LQVPYKTPKKKCQDRSSISNEDLGQHKKKKRQKKHREFGGHTTRRQTAFEPTKLPWKHHSVFAIMSRESGVVYKVIKDNIYIRIRWIKLNLRYII
jgi:hypothetical protein